MQDAKVQKPLIEALFYGTIAMKSLSYLIMRINIDFMR